MEVLAHHGARVTFGLFGDPSETIDGAFCFSLSRTIARCYGPIMLTCRISGARLFSMTVTEWYDGDLSCSRLAAEGYDGVFVVPDDWEPVDGENVVPEDCTFYEPMIAVWNPSKLTIVSSELAPFGNDRDWEFERAHAALRPLSLAA
jgi:hypothetical protein